MGTKNILITGGSGLVGSKLYELLLIKKYNIGVLSREKKTDKKNWFHWDYEEGKIDLKAIDFADIIIHLAGANISEKKWTEKQKNIIVQSRVETTKLLVDALKKSGKKLDLFVSASAVGYYGNTTSDIIFNENSPAGNDFLANVVSEWESIVDNISENTERIVKLRLGVVLDKNGGALKKMLKIVNSGFSAPLGTGKQYMPWIGNSDLAEMISFVIENKNINGVYNAVSREQITNRDFMKLLSERLNKPFIMPNVPKFVLKMIYGEMSTVLLEGSRVSSQKIQEAGFIFNENLKNIELR